MKLLGVQQEYTHQECQEICTRGKQLVIGGETGGRNLKDTQNMPTMGMRQKSILRVALWRTFVSAALFCSRSSPRKLWMISEVFSLLGEGEGLEPIEVSMRNDQGEKSGTVSYRTRPALIPFTLGQRDLSSSPMPRTRDGGGCGAGIEPPIPHWIALTEVIIRAMLVARVNVIRLLLAATGVPSGIRF